MNSIPYFIWDQPDIQTYAPEPLGCKNIDMEEFLWYER